MVSATRLKYNFNGCITSGHQVGRVA